MNVPPLLKTTNLLVCALLFLFCMQATAQNAQTRNTFKVLGFYPPDEEDAAHRSFENEAQDWLKKMGVERRFEYVWTNNLKYMNDAYLSRYDVVIFLNVRPENQDQRDAFKRYMDNGGAWMGFHFAGFAMSGSNSIQNWDWYHNTFLGSGEFEANTWKPTSAILKKESLHPVTKNLPKTFTAAPNEWYKWKNDLTQNPDITILYSIDPKSFPLGNGTGEGEIWYTGYYPVVWTNKNYKMLYFNMGHNDIDYEGGTLQTLSKTFSSEVQSQLILEGLLWLGNRK